MGHFVYFYGLCDTMRHGSKGEPMKLYHIYALHGPFLSMIYGFICSYIVFLENLEKHSP